MIATDTEINLIYTIVKSKRGLRKFCESFVPDSLQGLVKLPQVLLEVNPVQSEFETIATA